MQRLDKDVSIIRNLNNLSEIHHRDAIADMFDHTEVMGDKEVGQAKVIL